MRHAGRCGPSAQGSQANSNAVRGVPWRFRSLQESVHEEQNEVEENAHGVARESEVEHAVPDPIM